MLAKGPGRRVEKSRTFSRPGTGHGSIKGDDGLSSKGLFSRSFCSEFKSDLVFGFIELFNDFPATGNPISYQVIAVNRVFQFTDGGLADQLVSSLPR